MITSQSPDVKQRSRPHPVQKFSVRVDERAGITGSTRQYPFQNTNTVDTMNRRNVPGAVHPGKRELEVEV